MSPHDLFDCNLIYDPFFYLSYIEIWRSLGFYIPDIDDDEAEVDVENAGEDGSVDDDLSIVTIYPGNGTVDDPFDLTGSDTDSDLGDLPDE